MTGFLRQFVVSCCIAVSLVAMAQEACEVRGVVVDATGETLPYATVGAYSGTKNVKMLAADGGGQYTLQLVQGETYIIEITSVGYAPFKQAIELPDQSVYDMGRVALKSSTELDEVVVVSQKPIVKADAEKITYDVKADPESGGKTLLEMMRKVPMVTVDAEDNVQLNGSSDFKVLINGKESAMVKNNLKEVLKAYPASSVKDIQVITTPSVRYDAEGSGGVINIITAHNESSELSGIAGTISAYGEALMGGFGGNAYLTMQHKKFTASLNYSGGYMPIAQFNDVVSYNFNDPDRYRTILSSIPFGDLKGHAQYHFLTFESSYELDSLNLFTLGLSGNLGNYGASGKILNQIYSTENRLMSNYIDLLSQGGSYAGASANFDYQHTFNRPMHTLTASYRYEYSPGSSIYSDSILVDEETLNAPLLGQKNENNAFSHEHTVQLDYNNPINEMHSIEAGAKYIARINHSDDDYKMLTGNAWQPTGMAQQFDYTQQIAALYAGYGFTQSNWGFRVGGRYEMTLIDAIFQQAGKRVNYGKPYGNFVPYASLNYNVSPIETLRLSYTQRITRPGIHYLSPYEQWQSPSSVQSGNPDLQAEVSHYISAAYSIFKGKFNLNMEWFGRISTNAISPLTYIEQGTGILRTTYGNIANEQVYGLSAYISGQVSPKFNYYVNLQPAYKTFSAPHLDRSEARWGCSIFGGFNWTAWKDGTISINGGGGLPDGHMQMESELMWYYYSVGVTQRFFDDKLKVSVTASSFFNDYNRYRLRSTGDGFCNITNGGQRSARLGISISYTFGDLNARVKKAHRGIVNDDIEGGKSEGQGSSGGM